MRKSYVLRKNPQISQMDADDVEAIACAVPYLKDKYIRTVEPGEMIDDKNIKLVEGVKAHYEAVVSLAEDKRNNLRESAQSADKKTLTFGRIFVTLAAFFIQ